MREYRPTSLPAIKRIDGPEGRLYDTPAGLLPSVTSVLTAATDSGWLEEWRARIGVEEAERIAARAANRGTYIHAMCEATLKGSTPPSFNPFYADMWRSFEPLVQRVGDVIALEQPLYSSYLRVAGTVDCIGFWDGRLSVIDFKTSNRVKSHSDIPTYWMQCAAYAVAWEEMTRTPISQLVVLIAVEDEPPCAYVDQRNSWIFKFMEVRDTYKKTKGR